MIERDRRIRVLLVGCGRIAGGFNEQSEERTLTHVVAYRRAGADVVACCDIDEDAARHFASRWQIPQHGVSLQTLLANVRPDLVSVATPPATQENIVQTVVRNDAVRGMLLEKPLAADSAAADRMVSLVRAWGRPVVVNFFRAFDPSYTGISMDARAGKFGALRHAVGRYYGAARINASHLIERVLDLTDGQVGEPAAIADGQTDAPAFVLPFTRGGEAVFLPSRGLVYDPFELDLLFERTRLRVVDAERRVERFDAVPDPDFPGYTTLAPSEPPPAPSITSFMNPFDTIVRTLRHHAPPDLSGLERSAAVTRILDHVLLQGVS